MSLRIRNLRRDTFKSMHVRNFRLFFGGQLISQVGNWLTMIAMTLLVLKITGNGLAVGLMAACQFAPVLLFGPWAGLIADRSDKRKLLFIVQVIAMFQSFALASLAFMHPTPLIPLYLVALVGGFTVAFDNPARRAFVTEMVPDEDMNNAVSLNSALMTSSRIFGPALAGVLIHFYGYGWCFLVDAFSYIAVLFGLGMMRTSELRPTPVAVRAKGQVREGLRYVRTVPELWIPLVMMTLVGTLAFNFNVVVPLFVEKSLNGNVSQFTLVLSAMSCGSLVGALSVARRKSISIRDVVVASLVFGAAMALFAAAPSLGFAFPVAPLVGFGSISFLTASTAIVQIYAAPKMRGRVLALQAMVFLGSTPVGGPILGALSDAWGARSGLVVGALACFAAAAFGLIAGRRVLAAPVQNDRMSEVEQDLPIELLDAGNDARRPLPA
ncbi:MAG: arabinose efflux permease family protein [Actinomycetia bacterium]|nr:arabinose efflux permease family protein [Actinomycetes bacterium]